jgi:outer membrane protein assembly factor BamB
MAGKFLGRASAICLLLLTLAADASATWPMAQGMADRSSNATAASFPEVAVAWTVNVSAAVYGGAVANEALAFVGDTVGRMHALDLLTGEPIWSTKVKPFMQTNDPEGENHTISWEGHAGIFQTAGALSSGRLFAVTRGDGAVWCFNATTGDILWDRHLDGDGLASPAVIDEGLLVAVGQSVYLLDPIRGVETWSVPTGALVHSAPAYSGQKAFVGNLDGLVMAIDVESGDVAWETQLVNTRNPSVGFPIYAPLMAIQGLVVVPGRAGELVVLDGDDGTVLWRKLFEDDLETGLAFNGTHIFVAARDNLFALDLQEGRQAWMRPIPKTLRTDLLLAGGLVILQPGSGVMALAQSDGSILWTLEEVFSWAAFDGIAYAEGTLVVTDRGGWIKGIRSSPATESQVWTISQDAPSTGTEKGTDPNADSTTKGASGLQLVATTVALVAAGVRRRLSGRP